MTHAAAMADLLTHLFVELPSSDTGPQGGPERLTREDLVGEMTSAGGAVVHTEADGGRGRTIVGASFVLASDALRVASSLHRSATAPEAVDSLVSTSVRAAMCSSGLVAEGAAASGAGWGSARDLLGAAERGQVLVAGSTAVLMSHVVSPGVDLVDRGTRLLGGSRPERVYELRWGHGQRDGGTSNLGWARRAVPGPVVGRDQELSALDAAWSAAWRGQRRMVTVTGEAGIGKTTVVAAVALRIHARGGLVLYGRWDQARPAPYQGVREALATYATACPTERLRAELAGWMEGVARILPETAARVGVARPLVGPDPERDRLLVFEAIDGWLERLASRRPVLLVLEDLHWADAASMALVDYLRLSARPSPLLIVATERVGERGDTPSWLSVESGTDDEGSCLPLGGLDVAFVGQLVEHSLGLLVGTDDVDLQDMVRGLARDTAGNPLFVHEVLRTRPGTVDGVAALREARRAAPSSLGDLVRWRLEQLPAPTADVLSVASILGSEFDHDLLALASERPLVAMEDSLDPAVRAGLLRTDPDRARSAFVHELMCEALREGTAGGHAALVHRRVAAALAADAAAGKLVRPDQVARHYLQGVDRATVGAAVHWAREAAVAATSEAAFETAVELLTSAVEAHDRWAVVDADGAARGCELRLELAHAHDRARQFRARDHRILEAADIARRIESDGLLVRAALGFGGRAPAASPPEPEASDLLDEALGRVSGGDVRTRALLLARRTQIRQGELPYEQRRAGMDRALALARELDDPVVLATVLATRGFVLDGPDDPPDHMVAGAEIHEIGDRTGDRELELQGARLRIPALLALGHGAEARRLTIRFTELARAVRHPGYLAIASMLDVLWAIHDGDYDQGEATAELLRRQLATAGHPDAGLVHFGHAFALRWLRGGLETVRPELEALRSTAPDAPVWWAAAASLDVATGHEDRALAQLAATDPGEFLGRVDKSHLWWPTMTSCAAAAAAGDRTWAAAIHDALVPYTGRTCVFGYSVFAGAVDHYLGTLALAIGRYDQAVAYLSAGLDQHQDLGATPFVALSMRWLADALARRAAPGDGIAAASLAARGTELAERLGLQGIAGASPRCGAA